MPANEPESASLMKNFGLNSNDSDVLGIQSESPIIKRKRLDVGVDDVSSGLPEQILSDGITEGENLDLHLAEDNLPSTVDLTAHDVHLLTSSINVDSHSDIVSKALYDLGNNTTTVTPSSLSSGCLSAVNATRTAQVSLLAARTPQKLQNIHLKKLQLFGTQQQLLPTSDVMISVPVSNLSVSSECNLTQLPSVSQVMNKEPIMVQKPLEVCNSSIVSKTFQGLPLDSNIDIFNASIQGLSTQAVVLDSHAESNNTMSLVNTSVHNQNVPTDTSQTTSIQTDFVENIANCLPDAQITSSLQNSSMVTAGLSSFVPSVINTRVGEGLREFEVFSFLLEFL